MNFEQACIAQAVDELFKKKHFSICTVDAIGKMLGVNPEQSPKYKFLSGLHCVDYADMRPDVLAGIQQAVVECLRPNFNGNVVSALLVAEGSDFAAAEDRFLDIKH